MGLVQNNANQACCAAIIISPDLNKSVFYMIDLNQKFPWPLDIKLKVEGFDPNFF